MKNILNKKRLTICGAGGGGGGGSAPPPPPPPVITQYPGVLAPPQMGQLNSLASFSYAEMIDLLSDGPIDGLVNKFGRRVYDDNIFEGIYFNDTAIKETSSVKTFNFDIAIINQYLTAHFNYAAGESLLTKGSPRETIITTNYSQLSIPGYLVENNIPPGTKITSYHPDDSVEAFVNSRQGNVASQNLIKKAFDKVPVYGEKPFLTIIDIPVMSVNFPNSVFDTTEGGINKTSPILARISNLADNIYFSVGSDNLTSFNYFELPRSFIANDIETVSGKKTFSKSEITQGQFFSNFSAYNLKMYIWSVYGDTGIKNIDLILKKYFTKIVFYQNVQSLYNFNLVQSEFRSGSEIQAPLNYFDNISIDTEYKQALFGAYLVTNAFSPSNTIGAGGAQRLTALCGNSCSCPPVNISTEEETSDDIRYIRTWPLEYDCKGNPYIISNARINYTQFDKTSSTRTSQEAVPITHYIANENVDQVYVTIGVDQLFDTNHIDMISLNSTINGTKPLTAADVIGGVGTYAQLPGNYVFAGADTKTMYLLGFSNAGSINIIDANTNIDKIFDNIKYLQSQTASFGIPSVFTNNFRNGTYYLLNLDSTNPKTINYDVYSYTLPNSYKDFSYSFNIQEYINSPGKLEAKLKNVDSNNAPLYCFNLNPSELIISNNYLDNATLSLSAQNTSYLATLNNFYIAKNTGASFQIYSFNYYTPKQDQLVNRYIVAASIIHLVPWYNVGNGIFDYKNNGAFYQSTFNKVQYPYITRYILDNLPSLSNKTYEQVGAEFAKITLLAIGISTNYILSNTNWIIPSTAVLTLGALENLINLYVLKSNSSPLSYTSITNDRGFLSSFESVVSKFENNKLLGKSSVYKVYMDRGAAIVENNYDITTVYLYNKSITSINKTYDVFITYQLYSNNALTINAPIGTTATYQKITRSDDGQISTTASCDFSAVTQQVTAGTKLPAIVSIKVETGYENCESKLIGDYYSYKYDIFGIASQTFIDLGRRCYPYVYSQQLNAKNSATYGSSRLDFQMRFWVLYNSVTTQGALIFTKGTPENYYAEYNCSCIEEINFGQLMDDYAGQFYIMKNEESALDFGIYTKDVYMKSYGNLFANNQPLVDGDWKYIPGLNYVTAGSDWTNMSPGYITSRDNAGKVIYPQYHFNQSTSQTITFSSVGSNKTYQVCKIFFNASNFNALTLKFIETRFKEIGCIPSDVYFSNYNASSDQDCYLRSTEQTTTSIPYHRDAGYSCVCGYSVDGNGCTHYGWYCSVYGAEDGENITTNYNDKESVFRIQYYEVNATNIKDDYKLYSSSASDNIQLPAPRLDAYGKSIRRFVKVTKLSHETLSSLIQKQINLNKVTELIPQRFSYPFSAIVGTKIDSRSFSQVPNRTFDVKLKKVLIPSNYFAFNEDGDDLRYIASSSASAEIYKGDWDGTFKLSWTNNPAWILMDLLVNKRYGLGNYIESNQIDIWELYKISRWCDKVDDNGIFYGVPDTYGGIEPRFTFNILIKDRFNLFDMINQIASTFRGAVYYMNSLITFDVDRVKPPIGEFTNNDVKEGIFNYTNHKKDEEFTAVDVSYIDSKDNFKPKIEYVEDSNGIRQKGILKKTLNTLGTTSRGQARRIGKHFLYQVGKELTNVTFVTDLKALLYKPGDLIYVKDEMYNANKNFGYVKDLQNINSDSFKIVIDTLLDSGIYNVNEISLYTPIAKPKYEDMKSYTTSTPNGFTFNKNFLNVFARKGSYTSCTFFGPSYPSIANPSYASYLNGELDSVQDGWCGILTDIKYNVSATSSSTSLINSYNIYACYIYYPPNPSIINTPLTNGCCVIAYINISLSYIENEDIYNNNSLDGHWRMSTPALKVNFDTVNKFAETTTSRFPYYWEYFDTAILCMANNVGGGFTSADYSNPILFNPKTNNLYFNSTNLVNNFNILGYSNNSIPYKTLIESDRPSIETFYISGYATGCYNQSGVYNEYSELYITKSGKALTSADNGYFGTANSNLTYDNKFTSLKSSYEPLSIPIGSTYSLNILNKVNKVFKINSIAENYINEYNITAAEYDENKFKEIEEGAYVDSLENTFNYLNAYNISSKTNKANYLEAPIISDLSLSVINSIKYLTLKWNPVLNAKTYKVYIKTPSKQTENYVADVSASSIDATTNLFVYQYVLPSVYEQGTYTLGVQASTPFVDATPSVGGNLYSFSPESRRSVTLVTY